MLFKRRTPEERMAAQTTQILYEKYAVKSLKVQKYGWPAMQYFIGEGRSVFVDFAPPDGRSTISGSPDTEDLFQLGFSITWYDNVQDAVNFVLNQLAAVRGLEFEPWKAK